MDVDLADVEHIIEALMSLDCTKLSPGDVDAILEIFPSDMELAMVRRNHPLEATWGEPERFISSLADTEFPFERLQIMKLRHCFQARARLLSRGCAVLGEAIKQVDSSMHIIAAYHLRSQTPLPLLATSCLESLSKF
jgi:hypothetical protein